MLIQGVKVTSEMIIDLHRYAKNLGLDSDWMDRIRVENILDGFGREIKVFLKSELLATYRMDNMNIIASKEYHLDIPSKPDPLVFATEHELSQPSDPQWRSFKNITFRVSDVIYVNNIDDSGKRTGDSFTIQFRAGKPLVCGNEKNYANSGLSTFEWFLQHVIGLTNKRDEQQRNGEHHAD